MFILFILLLIILSTKEDILNLYTTTYSYVQCIDREDVERQYNVKLTG